MNQTGIVIVLPHHDDTLYDPKVELGWLMPPRPLQSFGESQLEMVPNPFRCFVCQEQHPRRDIGGVELEQTICRFCWPWIDEAVTGGLVRFDRTHSLPVQGYNKPAHVGTKVNVTLFGGTKKESLNKEVEHLNK